LKAYLLLAFLLVSLVHPAPEVNFKILDVKVTPRPLEVGNSSWVEFYMTYIGAIETTFTNATFMIRHGQLINGSEWNPNLTMRYLTHEEGKKLTPNMIWTISFYVEVPNEALPVNVNYQLKVVCEDGEWLSPQGTLPVYDEWLMKYSKLYDELDKRFETATWYEYESREAWDLANEAYREFTLAQAFAQNWRFKEAVGHLEEADKLLDRADEAVRQVQRGRGNFMAAQILSIVAIFILIVAVGFYQRRKRKKTKTATVKYRSSSSPHTPKGRRE